jgi:tryptophan 2,3-dioxygenase
MRISRYFDMLTTSFSIMENGMEVEQYMKFRSLPSQWFQSAQYRLIEFCCTDLNLIDHRFRATIDRTTPYDHAFEHLYCKQQARIIQQEKSYLLQEFERKYKDLFCVKWNNTIPSIFGKNSNNYQIKINHELKKCYVTRSYYKYYL